MYFPLTLECEAGGDARRIGGCSAADLESQLREFLTYYNATMAHPFAWTYTGKPLQKERRPNSSPHIVALN